MTTKPKKDEEPEANRGHRKTAADAATDIEIGEDGKPRGVVGRPMARDYTYDPKTKKLDRARPRSGESE